MNTLGSLPGIFHATVQLAFYASRLKGRGGLVDIQMEESEREEEDFL